MEQLELGMEKTEYTVKDLEDLAKQIRDQRDIVAEKKAVYSDEQAKLDEIEARAVRILSELKKTSYKSEFGTIVCVDEERVNLPATPEAKDAFIAYLKERGEFERMITFNSNTLNSFYKQEKEMAKSSGDALDLLNFSIPGIDEPKIRQKLQFRRK